MLRNAVSSAKCLPSTAVAPIHRAGKTRPNSPCEKRATFPGVVTINSRYARRGLLGLQNSNCGEALVAGAIALVHREQALVVGDPHRRDVREHLRIHLESPHFQLRISGRSSPCSSM